MHDASQSPEEARGITRRAICGMGALSIVGGLLPGGAANSPAQAAPRSPQPSPYATSPAAELVRMRCAPDGGWATWLYSGVLVMKPEGELARPVVRIEGFSFNRARVLPDLAGFAYELDEVGWYCDLESGEVLDRWTNPFTGREVKPGHYRSPQRLVFRDVHVTADVPLPPGTEFRGEIARLAEVAGLVAVAEDLYVRIPAQPATAERPARAARFSTSLATHTARAEDLARPAGEWLDCALHYGTMNSFAGWTGMDGIAGVQNMRLVGRKLPIDRLDAIPDWLLARARREQPSLFELPKT